MTEDVLKSRPLVIIESPWKSLPNTIVDFKYRAYSILAVSDSLRRGESPFASHVFFGLTGVLNDEDDAQRALGIGCGFDWGGHAETVAVYNDFGVSHGMAVATEYYRSLGKRIIPRSLFIPAIAGENWIDPIAFQDLVNAEMDKYNRLKKYMAALNGKKG